MAASPSDSPDGPTVAFRRLLIDAARDEQGRVDALLALSKRTVFAATWPGQQDAVRTLTNPAGQTAMPFFTGRDTLEEAATEYGWHNADGSLDFREMGARGALRHALSRGVQFMVVDLGSLSMVEFASREVEPVLHIPRDGDGDGERREATGPVALGSEPGMVIREAVRASTNPPVGGPGSFVPGNVLTPATGVAMAGAPPLSVPARGPRTSAPPNLEAAFSALASERPTATAQPSVSERPTRTATAYASRPPSVRPPAISGAPEVSAPATAAPLPGVTEPPQPDMPPPPDMGEQAEVSPPATTAEDPATGPAAASIAGDPTTRADPGHNLGDAARMLAAKVASGTDQARSLARRMAGRLGGALQPLAEAANLSSTHPSPADAAPTPADEQTGDAATGPVGDAGPATERPPAPDVADEVLDAVSEILRGYPEVEWACALPSEDAGAVIGLRVDPAFDQRADEIARETRQAAEALGASPEVRWLDSPDAMRTARQQGEVFFPGRRRAVPRG